MQLIRGRQSHLEPIEIVFKRCYLHPRRTVKLVHPIQMGLHADAFRSAAAVTILF